MGWTFGDNVLYAITAKQLVFSKKIYLYKKLAVSDMIKYSEKFDFHFNCSVSEIDIKIPQSLLIK